MKWFKHYCNMHQSETVQRLIAKYGRTKGYGLYCLFVAYFSNKWDGRSEPKFVVTKNELSCFLGVKQNQLSCFLVAFDNETLTFSVDCNNVMEIYFPKLAEILHKDSLSAGNRREIGGPKTRLDKKREDKEESTVVQTAHTSTPKDVIFKPTDVDSLIAALPKTTMPRWNKLYPDSEFITRELIKALGWCELNERRAPKKIRGWAQFCSNWLENGWRDYRKTIPIKQTPQVTPGLLIGGKNG